jgi:poly-gamma-glutamate synthesis protein (capsule biosynthesis protein)
MKKLFSKISLWVLFVGVCLVLCLALTSRRTAEQASIFDNELPAAIAPEVAETPPGPEPEPEPEPTRITLVAVGDNLLHMPIVNWCKTEDGYDFTPLYTEIKELVLAADMAFVNQESPLGGEGFAPSGYPTFNSPQQAGLALADTGFNIINQANNHGLDKGAKAVLATADFWEGVPEVVFIGINRSAEERAAVRVVEAQGYRFAWLAYSYGTNGMPMAHSYLMNLIDKDAMAADIEKAHTLADAVIVSLHWGNEYQLTPSREQRELAQFLADLGVKLIIGHHPHVVQPLEWVEGKDGCSTLVMYSLGNFVSNQNRRNTMLEGMLSVAFLADEEGITIEDHGVIPLVMHYERGYTAYGVYPLSAYTEDMARRHYINQLDRPVSLDFFSNLAQEIWGDYCK